MIHDFNAQNERTKYRYFKVLKEARGYSDATIDQAATSILEFERSTGFSPFSNFTESQAIRFKEQVRTAKTQRTKKPISAASVRPKLIAVKKFFTWYLENLPRGVRIRKDDVEFLSPNKQELALSKTSTREKTIPTLEQCKHLLGVMPKETPGDRRSRALVAFLCLTACRVTAHTHVRLKHVNLQRWTLNLDAKEIRTKAAKSFVTPFFPVDQIFYDELEDWIGFLQSKELFGANDPLFPRLASKPNGVQGFKPAGLSRAFIRSSGTLTRLVGEIFETQRLPKTSPHRFRDMIVEAMAKWDLTVEEHKVFSLALGHTDLSVTLSSYGVPTQQQQIEVMDRLRAQNQK